MDERASKYNINVVREVVVIGEAHHVSLIKKLLKAYYFLHVREGVGADAGKRDEMNFLIATVNLSDATQLNDLTATLTANDSPALQKFVYVVEPDILSREQLLLLQELGTRYVAYGVHRNEDLKEQLKRICVEAHQVGSLEPFVTEITRAIEKSDPAGLQRCIQKLKELPNQGEEVLKLLVQACIAANELRRAEAYLRRILEMNPQNLWAANTLGKVYLNSGRGAEGIEILERLSLFHELNSERLLMLGDAYADAGEASAAEAAYRKGDELTGGNDPRFKDGLVKVKLVDHDFKGALALLGQRGLSPALLSFLNMRAIIAMRTQQFAEGMRYYETAVEGAGEDKLVKAKLKFNMGLGYARMGELERAQQCLFESTVLGSGKFERARGPLAVVKSVIKTRLQSDGQSPGVGHLKEALAFADDREWETLY